MQSVANGLTEDIKKFGKIDVLINNAAHGLVGVFEAILAKLICNQFTVSVFGNIDVIREMLPHFRENMRGMNALCLGKEVGVV